MDDLNPNLLWFTLTSSWWKLIENFCWRSGRVIRDVMKPGRRKSNRRLSDGSLAQARLLVSPPVPVQIDQTPEKDSVPITPKVPVGPNLFVQTSPSRFKIDSQDTSDDEPDDEPSLSRTRVLKAPSNVKPLKSLDDTVSMLFSAEALPENDGQAAPQYLIPSLETRRIAPFRRYSINIPTVHHAFADHPKVSKPIQSEIPSLGYPCRNVPLILCNVCAFSVWSNQVGPGDYCSALECF